jgi:hypothetical protein
MIKSFQIVVTAVVGAVAVTPLVVAGHIVKWMLNLAFLPLFLAKNARSCLVIRPVGFFSDIKKPYILM